MGGRKEKVEEVPGSVEVEGGKGGEIFTVGHGRVRDLVRWACNYY